jgi:hypothetical protein
VTLHLDGAVAEALAAEAARRGQTADELAAALLAAQLPRRRVAGWLSPPSVLRLPGAARPRLMRCWPRGSGTIKC